MHKTRNDLSEKVRRAVIEILQPRLADAMLKPVEKGHHASTRGFSSCSMRSARSTPQSKD